MKHKIALLFIYTDVEAKLMAMYILMYVKKNRKKLTAMQGFELGVCSVEFQYNMRIIRRRASGKGEKLTAFDIRTNNQFIKIMESVDGLIEFITSEYDKEMNSMYSYQAKLEIERTGIAIPSYMLSDKQKKQCYALVKKLKLK